MPVSANVARDCEFEWCDFYSILTLDTFYFLPTLKSLATSTRSLVATMYIQLFLDVLDDSSDRIR